MSSSMSDKVRAQAASSPNRLGFAWCLTRPEEIMRYFLDGYFFLAIHPQYGVVHCAEDEETFEAKLNSMRPSVKRELYLTCTALWVLPRRE